MRQKIQVLLIEGNAGDADLICLPLLAETSIAFDIRWQKSLSGGIESIQEKSPDVILLNLDLPDSTGLQTLRALRAVDKVIPIVVLVARLNPEVNNAVIQSGAQECVVKGTTDVAFLPRMIRYALDRRLFEDKLRENEKALQERDDTLNKIFDLLPVGLWFADKDGKLLRGNPAGIEIWGAEPHVKPNEYGIFKARRLSTGENIQPQDWALAKTIRDGVTVAEELLEIEAFDGKTKIIANYSAPIIGADGKVQGAIVLNQDVTQRIKAEEFLQKSESSLRALLNAVDHSLFLMELDGTVVAINETTARRMGSTVDEMVGKNIYTYVNHEVAELRRGYADKVIQSGQPIHFIDQRFGRWIDNSIFPVLDEKGNVQRLAIYGQDITEKIQADEVLKLSEERFKTIFDQAPPGISVTDSKTGRFINVNARYAEIAGLSIEKLMQADWMQITDPRDLQADQDNMDLLLDGKVDKFQMEKRFVRPDGTTIWVNMTVVPIKVDSLTSPRHLSMAEDITERKRAEAELRTNEERYRIISTVSSDYMFYTHVQPDGSLTLDWTAGAFETMTGYSLEEYSATGGWRGHVFADDLEVDNRDIQQLRNNQSVETEIRTVCKDGSILWVQVSAMPVINEENGALIGIYGSVRDITERKHAEVELRESENKFRTLFMNTHTVMLILDPTNLRIIDANPAASIFYGWNLDTLRHKSMLEINTFGSEELLQNGKKALEGKLTSFQYQHRLASGEIRDVEVFSGPIEYEGRSLLFSIIHDISARKMTENALRESEERYRMVASAATEAIILQDKTGAILTWNEASERIFGVTEPEVLGNTSTSRHWKTYREDGIYLPGEEHPSMHTLSTGEPCHDVIAKVIRDDNTFSWISINTSPVFWSGSPLPDAVVITISDITERRNAEKSLRERERELSHLMNNLPGMAYRCIDDDNWTMLFVSQGCVELTGYQPEALILNSVISYQDLIDAEDRERIQQEIHTAMQENRTFTLEYRIHTADGSEKWVWERGALVKAPDTAASVLEGLIVDITSRKYAEQALQESENRFRYLYEQSPGPYQSLNEKGELIEVNNAWLAELGYTYEEVIGTSFGNYLIAEQQKSFQQNFARFKKLGEVHGIEYTMLCKNQHTINVSFDGRIVKDARGNFLQTHCVFTNITERKRTEAALKQFAEDLNRAQSVAHVGSWKWNIPTNTLEWSDEMYVIFGIDKTIFTGHLPDVIARAIHPDDREAVETANLSVIQRNTPSPLEYRVIHPDGTMRTVWAEAGELIVDKDGKPQVLTGIVQDITERKQAEAELLQKMNELMRFQRLTVGRELKMIELKKEINALLAAEEKPPRYRVDE